MSKPHCRSQCLTRFYCDRCKYSVKVVVHKEDENVILSWESDIIYLQAVEWSSSAEWHFESLIPGITYEAQAICVNSVGESQEAIQTFEMPNISGDNSLELASSRGSSDHDIGMDYDSCGSTPASPSLKGLTLGMALPEQPREVCKYCLCFSVDLISALCDDRILRRCSSVYRQMHVRLTSRKEHQEGRHV